MDHLDGIEIEDLQRALDRVEGKTAALRIAAAIAHKRGISQTELAEWFDVDRRTIYNWLRRLDDGPIERAAVDDDRSGRPSKLTDEQRKRAIETLRKPPSEAGFDAASWTPSLLHRHLESRFSVTYSASSCRRLLKAAGFRYRRSEPAPDSGTSRGSEERDVDASSSGEWLRR